MNQQENLFKRGDRVRHTASKTEAIVMEVPSARYANYVLQSGFDHVIFIDEHDAELLLEEIPACD